MSQDASEEPILLGIAETTPPQAVEEVVVRAVALNASDLFFATEEGELRISIRRLGLLQPMTAFSAEFGKRCLAYIKTQSNLDVAEKRRPQDGRWPFEMPNGRPIDLRVNTMPTLYGEDMALRVLDRNSQLLAVNQLGMLQRDVNFVLQMLTAPSGLILVGGPTGSGKTTTLYACLRELSNSQRKINTIEDPIEYALPNIRQSQIHPAIDVGFAELLRSVLRQSPDVIMIGEIRDAETAMIAVRAANSGHLVLATLHAAITTAAVQTMLGYGIAPFLLATSLIGIISQRLVRKLCPETRIPIDASLFGEMFEDVRSLLGPGEGDKIYGPDPRASTCPDGYIGRMGIYEVLPVTPTLRSMIVKKQPSQVLRAKAIEEGMIGLRQAALVAVAKGQTSVEELFRCIPSEYLEAQEVDADVVMKAE
ncbi:MAG: GspE/PulE family protein [Planctomycetes bacterium]|nr:GspE/PulE family protein [Planctomycetota bacterium]